MKMTKDQFRKKVAKAAILSSQVIDRNFPDALYDELKDENDNDILQALKSIAYSIDKLSLGNLIKHLMAHKSKRLEDESRAFKEKEKAEVKAFFQNEGIPEDIKKIIKEIKKI